MTDTETFEIAIDGGLGNQLFKFYAGLYFSEKFNLQPVFEISRLADVANLHPGENIQTLGLLKGYSTKSKQVNTPREIILRLHNSYSRRKSEFVSKSLSESENQKRFEIGYIEISQEMNLSNLKNCYFQSWRYFDGLTTKPRISLQSLSKPTKWLEEQLSLLAKIDPLVFHVRRGDYQLKKNKQLGCLSLDYYLSIANKISETNEIWLFTDSPNEVRDEFKNSGRKIRIIEPPSNSDPVESMILMSHSSRIIISNSTFSWWAAKFAQPGTSVYAPSKWFERRPDPTDLIPSTWERVDSLWVTEENFREY